MANILVVDDEENISYSVQLALRRAGHDCRIAETVEGAFSECLREVPDLALVDIQLPDGSGLDLLGRLREHGLDVPVIVITAFGTVTTAVAAMKSGAVDFLQKPLALEEVTLAVDRCLENRLIREQLDAYQEAQRRESGELRLVGECEPMKRVLSLADKVAAVPSEPGGGLPAILLLGETGTGKEMVARYIHNHSPRPNRPFVQVNCTAIPENLFEAELFGHEKGTFTDAKATKKGLLETAHEGTLLLDEIGDMPLATQAKLLVAIESGRFRRLGGVSERLVDVRIMAATNRDLEQRVARGDFRADLYYRLKVFSIDLPPLRERGDDLFLLTEHFLQRFCSKFHKPVPRLSPEARETIRHYPWPGNVRELANVLQRAVLLVEGPVLEASLLALDTHPGQKITPAPGGLELDFTSGDCTLAAIEEKVIRAALLHTRGNISEAARLLGLSRGNLRHRLDKLGLHTPD